MNSPLSQLRRRDLVIAYTLLRILFGVNFFNHGFVGIFGEGSLPQYAQEMVDLFQNTPTAIAVPDVLVRGPAFFVPIVELLIGIGITLGVGTGLSLVVGMVLLTMLTYGVTLLENWGAASSQLSYAIVFTLLIAGRCFNDLSVDKAVLRRQRRGGKFM
ncbi:MAG: DoxX family protein [Cyanobacteria bacterium P01_F01_bin.153]